MRDYHGARLSRGAAQGTRQHCGIGSCGSWRGQRPNLGDHVMGTGTPDGARAAEGGQSWLRLHHRSAASVRRAPDPGALRVTGEGRIRDRLAHNRRSSLGPLRGLRDGLRRAMSERQSEPGAKRREVFSKCGDSLAPPPYRSRSWRCLANRSGRPREQRAIAPPREREGHHATRV